jgi:RimJ/RimL family protein N-acetyltransferase
MSNKFVPDSFQVPAKLETKRFRLRMLSVDDVEKDYDAVMSSREHLNKTYSPAWPTEDMTLEDNLRDLKGHQEEFLQRKSFTYTVMNLEESKCLGCVYIYPSPIEDFDSQIFMWARSSELESGLDPLLFETVKKWIVDIWPFSNVAYPGRTISFEDWKNMFKKFVPDDFSIPEKFETEKFSFRKASVDDVEKNYDAVMSSREALNKIFGESWPQENMTKHDYLHVLKAHQEQFLHRMGFTYSVMNSDESKCLGSIYIYPCEEKSFDAQILMWVRTDELTNDLDNLLFNTVKEWVANIWPFSNVTYPGRTS